MPHSSNYDSTSNFPGMEGGPVFGDQNTLVGILIRPLRQKNSDSEIQVTCNYFSYSYSYSLSFLIVNASQKKNVALGNS